MSREFDVLVSRLKKVHGDENCTAFNRSYLVNVGGDVGHLLVTDTGVYEIGYMPAPMPLETYIQLLDLPEKPKEDLTGSDQE